MLVYSFSEVNFEYLQQITASGYKNASKAILPKFVDLKLPDVGREMDICNDNELKSQLHG